MITEEMLKNCKMYLTGTMKIAFMSIKQVQI